MSNSTGKMGNEKAPIENVSSNSTTLSGKKMSEDASFVGRYTALSLLVVILGVWGKLTFVSEPSDGDMTEIMHSYKFPLFMTVFYLISLPLLKWIIAKSKMDLKPILRESMILYNVAQVVLNGWMVYRFIHAVVVRGHPFVGDMLITNKGTSYAIWVHYCDKYLEFLDTYFMVLRGKTEQVSFLHVYHHTTIAWAWWIALMLFPGGDCYFGALLNSWIHVMMYSYYALSLLKIRCPWKKYLTQAQLLQFTSVVTYTIFSMFLWDREVTTGWHYFAGGVQMFEMISLFVLFFSFYRKAYSQKRKSSKNVTSDAKKSNAQSSKTDANESVSTIKDSNNEEDLDDQCQLAVAAMTNTTTETISMVTSAAISAASKESSKIVSTAKKVGPVQKHQEAMSRPSWSIVN